MWRNRTQKSADPSRRQGERIRGARQEQRNLKQGPGQERTQEPGQERSARTTRSPIGKVSCRFRKREVQEPRTGKFEASFLSVQKVTFHMWGDKGRQGLGNVDTPPWTGWDLGKREVQEPTTGQFQASFLSVQKLTAWGTGRCRLGAVFVTYRTCCGRHFVQYHVRPLLFWWLLLCFCLHG